jgi:hypothetical protein
MADQRVDLTFSSRVTERSAEIACSIAQTAAQQGDRHEAAWFEQQAQAAEARVS